MKVYLDDVRTPPDGWRLAHTAEEVIELLKSGEVTHLSLDHDLGPGDGDGYDVLDWLEFQVAVKGFSPPHLNVHSANPPARDRMWRAVRRIERYVRGEP